MPSRILVIDDERPEKETLRKALEAADIDKDLEQAMADVIFYETLADPLSVHAQLIGTIHTLRYKLRDAAQAINKHHIYDNFQCFFCGGPVKWDGPTPHPDGEEPADHKPNCIVPIAQQYLKEFNEQEELRKKTGQATLPT